MYISILKAYKRFLVKGYELSLIKINGILVLWARNKNTNEEEYIGILKNNE